MVSGSLRERFERYEKLIRIEPVRAGREIAKHLEGDPVITLVEGSEPVRKGSPTRERAMISGRVEANSLPAGQDQEAVFEALVAGAGFELCALHRNL